MKFYEFFSGKGTIARAVAQAGFEVETIDIRKRAGTCEPSIQLDILRTPVQFWAEQKIDVMWASCPCNAHSIASGNRYFANLVPKEESKLFLRLLEKTLEIIEAVNPVYFFIENPRGRMRYNKGLIDFMAKKGAMLKQTAWGLYGAPVIKPTDIFTNALDFEPLSAFKWGRGAKHEGKRFDNLTLVQKQAIPQAFAKYLATYLEGKLLSTSQTKDKNPCAI